MHMNLKIIIACCSVLLLIYSLSSSRAFYSLCLPALNTDRSWVDDVKTEGKKFDFEKGEGD